eukprot:TRINITY_DN145_c0_g1_i1.p1 TRINITY_DN145_c0_g1~~TRINITY_DN145_c0_g1_i1.p1  ORF type:complete len:291 (-),score=51.20 TRINITY_DN145_c0_g1_i1:608-1480(-)
MTDIDEEQLKICNIEAAWSRVVASRASDTLAASAVYQDDVRRTQATSASALATYNMDDPQSSLATPLQKVHGCEHIKGTFDEVDRSVDMGDAHSVSADQVESDWANGRRQAMNVDTPDADVADASHAERSDRHHQERDDEDEAASHPSGTQPGRHDSAYEAYLAGARVSLAARLDGATTLMVHKLPNVCTQDMFMLLVKEFGFDGEYDFLYMPTCLKSGRTYGYAFVNFPDADVALNFAFACKIRRIRCSRAALQGLEDHLSHGMLRRAMRIRNENCRPFIRNIGTAIRG